MNESELRTAITQEITAIQAGDELEASHISNALEWINSGAPLFRIKKPDTPPKHLVSYFVAIDRKHSSLLLVDHIKAQLWLPTGGHVRPGEHPKKTVERESLEELGLQARFLGAAQPLFLTINETGGLTPGHTDVSLWYLTEADRYDFITYERREFNDIEWFTFDEIMESDNIIFDRHMTRFMRKLLRYHH